MKDNLQKSPLYAQLRDIIRSKIEDGEYLPGEAIHSENELAEMYGMNRMTVHNAIGALVEEGLLKRVHGKGVYVVGHRIERDMESLTGFSQTMAAKGIVPSSKLLFKQIRTAGLKYAGIFRISPDEAIWYIRRLRFADDEPVALEDVFLPANLISGFEKSDLSVFSLYDLYSFNGIKLSKAFQTLSLTWLDTKEARMLKIKPDVAVLLFECITYDQNENVIEFSRTYTLGDKACYKVHFHNDMPHEYTDR